jgi:hypothetical protein
VPEESVPTGTVVSRTGMPSVTCSGSGGVCTMLPRTSVPPQSTTPATNGTSTPSAANATMVNERRVPVVATGTSLNSRSPQLAHALRRSKNRAEHEVHSCATRWGSPSRAR